MTAFARLAHACWTRSPRSRTTCRSPNPRVCEEFVRSIVHLRVWLISMQVPLGEIFQPHPNSANKSRVTYES